MKTKEVSQDKKIFVDDLKTRFENEKEDWIFTDYRGLNVGALTTLRRTLKEKNANVKVIKNSALRRVFEDKKALVSELAGPTMVIFAKEESSQISKVVVKFFKENKIGSVKCALVEGDFLDKTAVEKYSKLPSKKELYSVLLGTLQAPIQKTASTLNEIPTQLVRVLNQLTKKQ